MSTNQLLIDLILYGLLPLWGIAGFVDWCCHRATRIESTSGIRESLLHSLMGVQLGIPILLCLLFQINVLVLLVCICMWLLHEFVAHRDVRYSAPLRHICIWEVHAHNYLATLPLYLLMLIAVLNIGVVEKLFTLRWGGEFTFTRLSSPHGSRQYLPHYLLFMGVVCVGPYLEENLRCLRRTPAASRVAR